MKPVFRSPQARQKILDWHDKFRSRLTVPVESRLVPTRFGETHVLVGGPVDGAPVVMLHGALASSAHLLVELAPLLATFRVYSVDVMGQSVKSADARPRVDNDDYGHWLGDVFDGLSLPHANLIGVSWGGFAAQRFAALAPQRIDKLVLLVPAGMVKSPVWAGITRMALPMTMFHFFPNEQRLRAFVKNLLTTLDDDWMPYLGDAFRSYNMDMRVPSLSKTPEFTALQAPVFVLAADDDVSFPGAAVLSRAKELFPKLAGAELLEDCRHSPPTTPEFRAWMGAKLTAFFNGAA